MAKETVSSSVAGPRSNACAVRKWSRARRFGFERRVQRLPHERVRKVIARWQDRRLDHPKQLCAERHVDAVEK